MSRLLLLAGLLVARVALADPASVFIEPTGYCGLLGTDGQSTVLGALRITFTQSRTGVVTWTCTGQTTGIGQTIRYTSANYGTCGTATARSDRWAETISASGRISLTCTVNP